MNYIAILYNTNNSAITKEFKSEEEFVNTMKTNDDYSWGYLFHTKTGTLITSFHSSIT